MGIALYRKYRPQTFKEVTGQNHVRTTLQNEIASNAVAHAYLFTGPRGVGKTSLARIFARALNCLKRKEGESEPCNDCDACREQSMGRSLDVIEIDAASNTGVDNVRENVIEQVRFAPSSRKYKVFIIDEVHMLSTSAWNALLKTLEEPPSHAVFVMATTEVHKVPATIVSRCQRFDFKRIPSAAMAERLKHMAAGEGVTVDDAVIAAVAKLGDGCLRDAESLLEQVLSLDEKNIGAEEAALVLPRSNSQLVSEFVDALAVRNGAEAVAIVNRLIEEGVDLQQFASETVEYLRALLIAALGAPSSVTGTDATKRLGAAHLVRLINSMLAARIELKSAVIPQLPLELVAAEHCGDSAASAEIKNNNDQITNRPSNQKPPQIERKENAKVQKPKAEETPAPGPSPVAPSPEREKRGGEASAGEDIKNSQNDDAVQASAEALSQKPTTDDQQPTTANVSLETLALRWDELCIQVQDENPSLPFLLRVSRPLRFEDGDLVIGVQYKLHADKLNQEKNRSSVIRGLTALYNCGTIPVRTIVVSPEEAKPVSGGMTDSLLSQFGGTVVE